jgi:hypothetical protein
MYVYGAIMLVSFAMASTSFSLSPLFPFFGLPPSSLQRLTLSVFCSGYLLHRSLSASLVGAHRRLHPFDLHVRRFLLFTFPFSYLLNVASPPALLLSLLDVLLSHSSTRRFPFVCVIYAITGFKTDVQQLAQMLGAALVPGNSQANMYFTLYGYNSTAQGLALARDLKMAQYTKLPPRTTLWAQSLGTVVGAILQLVIMKSVISAQRELLLDTQGAFSVSLFFSSLVHFPSAAPFRLSSVERLQLTLPSFHRRLQHLVRSTSPVFQLPSHRLGSSRQAHVRSRKHLLHHPSRYHHRYVPRTPRRHQRHSFDSGVIFLTLSKLTFFDFTPPTLLLSPSSFFSYISTGLFVPLPFYVAHRFFPKLGFNTVVTPIVCWCLGNLSVGINSSVFTTMLIAITSQFVLRKYASTWFRKYNYLMSAGLDGGTQFMGAFSFPPPIDSSFCISPLPSSPRCHLYPSSHRPFLPLPFSPSLLFFPADVLLRFEQSSSPPSPFSERLVTRSLCRTGCVQHFSSFPSSSSSPSLLNSF